MPRLTTVIPVYNGETFLATTLASIARQTRLPDQVVVLDNCSTDGTHRIVESFRATPVTWRQNAENIGHTRNLNQALDLSTETDYLHILLADDLIKPTFYEELLGALLPCRGPAIGYSPYDFINESGEVIPPLRTASDAPPRRVPLREFLVRQSELETILIPAVLLKTDRTKPPCHLPPDMPQVGDCTFYAEWGRAVGEVIEVPRPLCQYRTHPAQTTARNEKDLQAWVMDDWKVMTTVLPWIPESRMSQAIRRQKLTVLFAARCVVKYQMVIKANPGYAAEIQRMARAVVGESYWQLGKLAVWVRSRFTRRPRDPAQH